MEGGGSHHQRFLNSIVSQPSIIYFNYPICNSSVCPCCNYPICDCIALNNYFIVINGRQLQYAKGRPCQVCDGDTGWSKGVSASTLPGGDTGWKGVSASTLSGWDTGWRSVCQHQHFLNSIASQPSII